MMICKQCKSRNIVESAYVFSNSHSSLHKKEGSYSMFYEWSDKPETYELTYYCLDCRESDCAVSDTQMGGTQ